MSYRVLLQRLAREDLGAPYRRAAEYAPGTASRWLNRFRLALQTLDQRPERCPLAPESRKCGVVLRQYLFGKKPRVYRVVFVIDDETVRILRIRRAQRRLLSRTEINEVLGDISEESA
jgi:plasmid stabilization system protein ParE